MQESLHPLTKGEKTSIMKSDSKMSTGGCAHDVWVWAIMSKTARLKLEGVQYIGQILGHACSSQVSVLARGPVHCSLLPTLRTEQFGMACRWIHCLWRNARQPESPGCQRKTFWNISDCSPENWERIKMGYKKDDGNYTAVQIWSPHLARYVLSG